jgi:solute carrier family 25 2-oxodicarboxylate transporter 21
MKGLLILLLLSLILSISSTIVVPSIVAKSIVNKKIVTKTTTGVSKDNSLLKQLGPVLCSSFFATAMIYPLDIVRSLTMANTMEKLSTAQLLNNFRKVYGIQGFFKQGLIPELTKGTWARFVKFGLYPVVHKHVLRHSNVTGSGTAVTKAVAGILTTIPEIISIMPLEIAKLNLQLDTTNKFANNMFNAMGEIFKTRGIKGFTVGYWGLQYRQAAWTAGYFATLSFFEEHVDKAIASLHIPKSPTTKAVSQLLSGFLAGVFGTCLNTPGDTIRSLIQKRVFGNLPGETTLLGVAREIVQSRGVAGLYAGFKFKAFHLGSGGALMALLLPLFRKLFDKL